jgi:hypothetical protein
MQRQGSLPPASVKAEQMERERLLHAAALSMNAENSNEAAIEKVSTFYYDYFTLFWKQLEGPRDSASSVLDQMVFMWCGPEKLLNYLL